MIHKSEPAHISLQVISGYGAPVLRPVRKFCRVEPSGDIAETWGHGAVPRLPTRRIESAMPRAAGTALAWSLLFRISESRLTSRSQFLSSLAMSSRLRSVSPCLGEALAFPLIPSDSLHQRVLRLIAKRRNFAQIEDFNRKGGKSV